ncbi:EAL domain-containing protein [Shewanella algae]
MKAISEAKRYLLLFLLPLLLLLLSSELLLRPVTNVIVQNQSAIMMKFLAKRAQAINSIIEHQVSQFHFDCGPTDAQLLRAPEYYNRYFRIIGVKNSAGVGCSSLGIDFELPDLPKEPLTGQQFGLSQTKAMYGTDQELLLYFRRDNNLAYWVLDSSWIRELISLPCSDCYYLELQHLAPGLEQVSFERGNREVPREHHVHYLYVKNLKQQVELRLWFGQKLHQYAWKQIFAYGVPSSLLLGLLLVAGYSFCLNRHCSLGSMLRKGVVNQEFVPFYQPIMDVRQGKLVGYEVLVRWKKDKEFISPAAFIEHAENCGLIIPITESLLQQVLQHLPELEPNAWVSINLVAAHLERGHLSRLLEQNNWPEPGRLKFEVTERLPIADIETAKQEIAKLSARGYGFTIDDFGTGYGGFKYIQTLGIGSIKVDKMFTDTIGTNDLKLDVLNAIIAFGLESGLETIVEGVETAQQLAYLKSRGVYLVQGYYFACPMPVEELKNVI